MREAEDVADVVVDRPVDRPVDRLAFRKRDKGEGRAVSIAGIAAADPRDLGEMIAAIIGAAPDPDALLRELLVQLRTAAINDLSRRAVAAALVVLAK